MPKYQIRCEEKPVASGAEITMQKVPVVRDVQLDNETWLHVGDVKELTPKQVKAGGKFIEKVVEVEESAEAPAEEVTQTSEGED